MTFEFIRKETTQEIKEVSVVELLVVTPKISKSGKPMYELELKQVNGERTFKTWVLDEYAPQTLNYLFTGAEDLGQTIAPKFENNLKAFEYAKTLRLLGQFHKEKYVTNDGEERESWKFKSFISIQLYQKMGGDMMEIGKVGNNENPFASSVSTNGLLDGFPF